MQRTIRIEKTKCSPEVLMDPNGTCYIGGESYPEDSYEFYAPIIKWMKTYIETAGDKRCEFNFEMIYFNSSSSKILWDIFDMLEDYAKDGKNVAVNWIYEIDNDAGLEYGEEFSEDMEHLEFNFVVKEEK
jgi:hypothetical protein